ncbi:MAG: CPBP family intramembrane glutamic endopeptidase [Fimbriimonadaceae bacterium]
MQTESPREVWIKRELILLLSVWSCEVVFSIAIWLHNVPFFQTWGNCAYSIGLGLGYVAIIWGSGDDWSEFGLTSPHRVDWLIGLILFAVASAQMWPMVPKIINYNDSDRHVIALMLGCLFYFPAGLSEELFFRGLIQARATEISRSPWIGIAASTTTFTVVHIYQSPSALWYTALFGLAYGYARYRSVSIWVLAISHTLVNALIAFGYPAEMLRLLQLKPH